MMVAMNVAQDREVGAHVTPILNHRHPTITIHVIAAMNVIRTYMLHTKRVRCHAVKVLKCKYAS